MVAVKEKGKEVWLPAGEAGKKFTDRVEAGGLYLVTDKGERKATGSFYTPEYIVKYIVKNTLAPLIDPMIEEAMWSAELRKDLLKKLLSLKVLDPAMGSGHFLVEATDYIAREIIHAKEIARREDLESEEVAENDIHWARREVVRNCIYGVDLNPLAVELAKLSLWLTTVAANKPLNFLDHHLRCGNSLIGAKLDSLMVLPNCKRELGQLPMWQFVLKQQKEHSEMLLRQYSEMAAQPDDDLRTVKEKEKKYKELRGTELSQRLNELANIWISTYFGNNVDEYDYEELQNHLSPNRFPDWNGLREREWFKFAQVLAEKSRFFHWELEFPEAFFEKGRKENPGFDAVIGNPPWEKISAKASDKSYLNAAFEEIREGEINFFTLFLYRCSYLAQDGGKIGQLVPNTWLINKLDGMLRKFILTNYQIYDLYYLCKGVFKDAPDTIPVIVNVINYLPKPNKIKNDRTSSVRVNVANPKFLNQPNFIAKPEWSDYGSEIIWSNRPFYQISVYDTERNRSFCQRIEKDAIQLGDLAHASDGIYKSTVESRKSLSRMNESDRQVIESADQTSRYELDWSGAFIPKDLWSKHQTLHKGSKIILHAARKPTLYRRLVATYSDECIFFSNRFIIIKMWPSAHIEEILEGYTAIFMLAILNSKLMNKYFKIRFPITDVDAYMLHQLPIRRISFTTPAPERARLGAQMQQLYADGKHADILAQVDSCLPKDEAGNFIAELEKSDVVHDLLAFLAERMLEMNKQKQQEIKGFLGWLESYLGAKVEDLTPKTKLQGYYEHDYESFLAVLKRNSKKLAVDPSRREPAETLRAEFEGSVGKLGPLRERIRQTDDLIDAIVYRLYGLTEEEILIVEGREIAKSHCQEQ
jgi:hypothetical protein